MGTWLILKYREPPAVAKYDPGGPNLPLKDGSTARLGVGGPIGGKVTAD